MVTQQRTLGMHSVVTGLVTVPLALPCYHARVAASLCPIDTLIIPHRHNIVPFIARYFAPIARYFASIARCCTSGREIQVKSQLPEAMAAGSSIACGQYLKKKAKNSFEKAREEGGTY
eukprot:3389549-Rhodomonas_salina.2